MLTRRDWAEEALQDGLMKIWNHAGDFDSAKGKAFTWMATIVRNRCLDQLRRTRREPLAKHEPMPASNPSEDPDPLAQVEFSQDAQALKKCLEELSAEERQAILLAYWGGRTHQELAETLARPLGTVKSWIRRGLERLKGCLER